MVKQLSAKLSAEYPEVLELNYILDLASVTWPRYGLSAKDLSEQEPSMLSILKILTGQ